MERWRIGTVSVVILSLLAMPLASEGPRPADNASREAVRQYLTGQIGFSDGDWRDILDGKAVARNLDAEESIEVSIYGAVRIAGRPDDLAAAIKRIESLERALEIDGVGRFDATPRLEDLADVRLLDQDAGDLRHCRPGNCELQLSAHAMERFDAGVDWTRDDARQTAEHLYREILFETLRAYRLGGAGALPPYADQDPPVVIADEMRLLEHPADTPVPIPALRQYLRAYPRDPLPDGAESFFYWNTGDFGMKPTTRVNQVVILPIAAPPASMPGARYVIATHQVYANHYFTATLELRTLVEDDEDGFFLLYATRSRIPGLSGFFKALLRAIVKRRARSGMERYLTKTRQTIESGNREIGESVIGSGNR